MNRDDYNEKYDALALRFNKAQERLDTPQRKKQTIAFEADIMECFMSEVQSMAELPVEFPEHL